MAIKRLNGHPRSAPRLVLDAGKFAPNGRRRRSIPAACPLCPLCPFAAPAKDGGDGKERRDTNLVRGASVSPRKAGAPFNANAKGRSTISFRPHPLPLAN